MQLPQKLCFVDIETTGMRSSYDRIIEIGIIRAEAEDSNYTITKTLKSLINTDYIPLEITNLTGISPHELENAPSFRQIKDEILEIMEGCVMVAHNVRFDYSFLKNEFKRLDVSFSPKHFCTIRVARSLFPKMGSYKLDALIEKFNIECRRRHRAFDDAKVLWDFFQIICNKFSKNKLIEVLNIALKKPTIPLNLSKEVLDNVPQSPGVYIFYGANGTPLYVGKSINIKNRVLSHFSSDHSSPKEMEIAQQVESIETIKTAGELGAFILESGLVKKLQPLYNRKLRILRKMVILKSEVNKDGYKFIQMEEVSKINLEDTENTLAIFKSRKQAKDTLINLVKDYSLCEKLLGLEKTKSACFAYRLGICKGACINKEGKLKYNLRFLEAFLKTKVKSWPFKGPILIKENMEEKFEYHLVDKWCYLGKYDSEDSRKEVGEDEYQFDVDTYKILEKYLRQRKINIMPLHSSYFYNNQ